MNHASCLYVPPVSKSVLVGIPLTSHSSLRATMDRLQPSRFQAGPASTTGFLAMTAELLINDAAVRQFC